MNMRLSYHLKRYHDYRNGWLGHPEEQQIIKRDNNSWLIDGKLMTWDMLLKLTKCPMKRNASRFYDVSFTQNSSSSREFGGYKFEVVDVDHFKID